MKQWKYYMQQYGNVNFNMIASTSDIPNLVRKQAELFDWVKFRVTDSVREVEPWYHPAKLQTAISSNPLINDEEMYHLCLLSFMPLVQSRKKISAFYMWFLSFFLEKRYLPIIKTEKILQWKLQRRTQLKLGNNFKV